MTPPLTQPARQSVCRSVRQLTRKAGNLSKAGRCFREINPSGLCQSFKRWNRISPSDNEITCPLKATPVTRRRLIDSALKGQNKVSIEVRVRQESDCLGAGRQTEVRSYLCPTRCQLEPYMSQIRGELDQRQTADRTRAAHA